MGMQNILAELNWDAWVTLAIILLMLCALIKNLARPEFILLAALGCLLLFGILTPEKAFAGFSNQAVLAVGALFVVAAGVQNTGALLFIDRIFFPNSPKLPLAIAQMMLVTAFISAFLNNTPTVAMLIPRVQDWCKKTGVSTSKVMIPLSYAAIVGGMTTLIGTSTNLLVAGLMQASGYESLKLFDFFWVGVPAALCTILYFALVGHHLLPNRGDTKLQTTTSQTCVFDLRVSETASFIGKSIEAAGLRSLKEAYLVHLLRQGQSILSAPDLLLQPGDILTFLGTPQLLEQLLEKSGLERVHISQDTDKSSTLPLFDAVVAPGSNLIGKSLRAVGFREHYRGIVLGIHRHETDIEGPLSMVPIKAGDLLLIEAKTGFDSRWNQNKDEFYLVAPRQRSEQTRLQSDKAPLALLILTGVIFLAAIGLADIATTAFIGALAMILTGCLPEREARKAIDMSVLIIIASSLGLGQAIEGTGLAKVIAHLITEQAAVWGALAVLAAIYFATSLLTEIITNNAAAALMLGIAMLAAQELGAPPKAFALAVAIAASASFMTPIGYQTNLMVLSAGSYRFSDFIKTGIFVNLIVAVISLAMIQLIWL